MTSTGTAYCWGDNDFGQLANGTNTQSHAAMAVSGGYTFAFVTAGYGHTCGVTVVGAAYCWGWNLDGQLGNGTNSDSNVPVAVTPSRARDPHAEPSWPT